MVVVDEGALHSLIAMGLDAALAQSCLKKVGGSSVTLALEMAFASGAGENADEQSAIASTGPQPWRTVRHRMHVEKNGSECPRPTWTLHDPVRTLFDPCPNP